MASPVRRTRGAVARGHRFPSAAAVLIALVPLAPSAASAAVLLHPDPPGMIQNETSVSLLPGVPGVPAHLAVAFNSDPLQPFGLGASFSTDGGASWVAWAVPLPLDPSGSGTLMTDAFDPACDHDTSGNLFVAHISTLGGHPGLSGLFVHRYDTTTMIWHPSTAVAWSPAATSWPDPFYRFHDKCHLEVDRDPAGLSPHPGRVWVTWIQDGGNGVGPWSDIFVAWSDDRGLTWNFPGGSPVPVPINDGPYVPGGIPPFDMANGPNLAVAPDGTVWVAWMDVDVTATQAVGRLRIDRSVDGGLTWGADRTIDPGVLCVPAHLGSAFGADARARSFPCVVVAPTAHPDGTHDLCVVLPADPDGLAGPDEADVFSYVSPDDGTTWWPPVRVHGDATTCDQFQPWADVKPDGTLDVVWYDRRHDGGDFHWEPWIARSNDMGRTFAAEMALPGVPAAATPLMTWGERWMGEYPGLAVDDAFAYVAFTSGVRDPLGDCWFQAVENAALAVAAPSLPDDARGDGLAAGGPNPFDSVTSFSYRLRRDADVRLTVHDVAGRRVRTLAAGPRPAGAHRVTWDGRDDAGNPVPAGLWLVRLDDGWTVRTIKATRVR